MSSLSIPANPWALPGQHPPSTGIPLSGASATQHGFSPYDFNGGTTLAISGEDFAVVAGTA